MPKYKFSEIAYNITDKKMPEPGDEELYIGLEHLDSGSLRVTRWGSEVELVGQKLVMQKGDILFGRRNTYLRRAAIAPHDGIFSAHGMIFRPNTAVIDPDYFPFFISSDYFMDAAIRISVGSLSPTVNWKTLKELEFFLPDLNQQRHTAELLSAANETKEAYQDLLIRSDELVKSQFIELFGSSEMPCVKLKDVAVITSGLTKNSKRPMFPNKMMYLRVANVLFNELDLSDVQTIGVQDAEIEKCLLKEGDLLFVEGNGSPDQIGRVSVWDGSISPILHQNHIIKARFNTKRMHPQFAMYYFMTAAGREQILNNAATTSGLYTLSLSKIANFSIPAPSIDEQKAFLLLAQQLDKSKYVPHQLTPFLEKLVKYELQSLFQEECICSQKM